MAESNKRQKTKMIIENAMVELLEHESFDQISTVKLTKTAGISRSSFYTHYKDKYDMIEHYQQKLFHKLEYIFEKYAQAFLRHKFQIMLAEDLQERFSSKLLSQVEKEYSYVYLTNAFFGVCQMWIARGKKESPEQMADFLLKMLD